MVHHLQSGAVSITQLHYNYGCVVFDGILLYCSTALLYATFVVNIIFSTPFRRSLLYPLVFIPLLYFLLLSRLILEDDKSVHKSAETSEIFP